MPTNTSTSLGKCPYTHLEMNSTNVVYMICGHPHHMSIVPYIFNHNTWNPTLNAGRYIKRCATCGSNQTAIVPQTNIRTNTYVDTDEIEFVGKTIWSGDKIPSDFIDISIPTEDELQFEHAAKKLKMEMQERSKIREEEDKQRAKERAMEDDKAQDDWW